MRAGRLSKRDLTTLRNALDILGKYVDWHEEHGKDVFEDYELSNAMTAETGLGEFLASQKDQEAGTKYAIYHSPFGTFVYGFETERERQKFIEEKGRDFCEKATRRELGRDSQGRHD